MQYLGGKSKIRKQVAAVIEQYRKDGQEYFEPFVGGGWILQEVKGKRTAADGNAALIALYVALQNGWEPPEFVSEGEWRYWRNQPVTGDPMKAFCGFGCSFGGKWFGGYARSGARNYASETQRRLKRLLPMIQDVSFLHGNYTDWTPHAMLVYCDPPYAGTTTYGAFDGFDTDLFWNTMRKWSETNTVIVSEYEAPEDFCCIAEFGSRMGLTTGGERPVRAEKVFMRFI